MRSTVAGCLLAGWLLIPVPAGAEPAAALPDGKLKDVERQLEETRSRQRDLDEKAATLAREVEGLRADLVAAARQAQDTEEELSALEAQLRDLKARETDLQAALQAEGRHLAAVLTGLERLALRPPEALLVLPAPPEDTVRAALLLRTVAPAVQEKVAGLRGELADLAAVRKDMAERRTRIAVAAAKLDKQHARLATLFERKAGVYKATTEESAAAGKRAQDLARDAQTLRDLLARLEEERRKREEEERRRREEERRRQEEEARRLAALAAAGKPVGAVPPRPADPAAVAPPTPEADMESQRGTMPMPARGRILARYGEAGGEGQSSKGLSIATRSGAQVVAPAKGTVAFAGPFRGYGLLLILEHPGGYHSLLSGFGRLDAGVGQTVLAGEPVGAMDATENPVLYLELRRDGQPINPLPWLTARKG